MNNVLGYRFATGADFEQALDDYLESSQREGLIERRTQHQTAGGWYSSEIITHALNTISMAKAGKIQYVFDLQPLCETPHEIHACIGALVNIGNTHWIALKAVSGKIWHLDSQKLPRQLDEASYRTFLEKHKAAYKIHIAEDIGATLSTSVGPSLSLSSGDSLPIAEVLEVDPQF